MFKFELGQNVKITVSGEVGEVVGRADYSNSESSFFIRYKSADGRAVEEWWREQALEVME
jgi:hypothetical protein